MNACANINPPLQLATTSERRRTRRLLVTTSLDTLIEPHPGWSQRCQCAHSEVCWELLLHPVSQGQMNTTPMMIMIDELPTEVCMKPFMLISAYLCGVACIGMHEKPQSICSSLEIHANASLCYGCAPNPPLQLLLDALRSPTAARSAAR